MGKTLQKRLAIPESIIDQLPENVKNEFLVSSSSKQGLFVKLYLKESHSLFLTYLFLFPALFSFHYGAMNNWYKQVLFWVTGGGLLIWWFIDIIRLPSIVKEKNDTIACQIWGEVSRIGEGPAEGLF